MSWSYNESLTTDRDKIRLRIGDVDTYEQLLSNETIDALLTVHNSDLAITAVSACRAILAAMGRDIDRNAAGMSSGFSARYTHYKELLAELRKEARYSTGAIFNGSFSRSRKDAINSNSDFIQPSFKSRMDNYPGSLTDDDPDWIAS